MNSKLFNEAPNISPVSPRSPHKSPSRPGSPRKLRPIMDLRNRKDLFGSKNEGPLVAIKLSQSNQKRIREVDPFEDVKRRRIEERMIVKERPKEIKLCVPALPWIAPELWRCIASSFATEDCVALGSVSKEYCKVVYNDILPSHFWLNKLSSEYLTCILKGDVIDSHRVLGLLNRTFKLVKPLEEVISTCNELKERAQTQLKKYAEAYCDSNNFLFKIFLDQQPNVPAYNKRVEHLDTVKNICERKIVVQNNCIIFCHTRKIIEYYLKWEDTKTLHTKAIRILFAGLEHTMLGNDGEDFNPWINLIGKSFDYLNEVEKDLWFNKSVALLKKGEDANLVGPKKQMLGLIEQFLPEYLKCGNKYVLLYLVETLRNKGVCRLVKNELEDVLKGICTKGSMIWVNDLMKAIVDDRGCVQTSIAAQIATNRIIGFAISQHGGPIVDKLLNLINDKLPNCEEHCKIAIVSIVAEVYKRSEDHEKMIIMKGIKAFLFNRLMVDFVLFKEMHNIVQLA